eukprot:15452980-Alexandrium_andersonii.AAC.1
MPADEIAAQQAAAAAMAVQQAAAQAQQAASSSAQPGQELPPEYIDKRAFGRPGKFSGEREDWEDWASITRGYFTLISPGLNQRLYEAETRAQP